MMILVTFDLSGRPDDTNLYKALNKLGLFRYYIRKDARRRLPESTVMGERPEDWPDDTCEIGKKLKPIMAAAAGVPVARITVVSVERWCIDGGVNKTLSDQELENYNNRDEDDED
jgi:hypothetical protein